MAEPPSSSGEEEKQAYDGTSEYFWRTRKDHCYGSRWFLGERAEHDRVCPDFWRGSEGRSGWMRVRVSVVCGGIYIQILKSLAP